MKKGYHITRERGAFETANRKGKRIKFWKEHVSFYFVLFLGFNTCAYEAASTTSLGTSVTGLGLLLSLLDGFGVPGVGGVGFWPTLESMSTILPRFLYCGLEAGEESKGMLGRKDGKETQYMMMV